MKLEQYLGARKMTDAAFAALVGMSQSQISRLRRGLSRPSWNAVAAIEQATNGNVGASDFVSDTPAPTPERAA